MACCRCRVSHHVRRTQCNSYGKSDNGNDRENPANKSFLHCLPFQCQAKELDVLTERFIRPALLYLLPA